MSDSDGAVGAAASEPASAGPGGKVLDTRQALTDAATGVLFAIVFVLLVSMAAARFWITDAHLGLLLSYLAVWVPLLGAVAAACWLHGSGSLGRDFGLRFHPLDLLWGLAIGLLARLVASLIEIAGYGQMGTTAPTLGETVYDGWWLFGSLLAPVLLAPFIEELFFRGLLLRAVLGVTVANRNGRGLSMGIAIVVSGVVFALLHVLEAGSISAVVVVGVSTFLFGAAAASVAALTGRLGGAIVAHVTFNALVIVPALLHA